MAQLFRVTKLHDLTQSQTFTFILPWATCQENPPEILSRDFVYAGHKWRLSLMKKDKHLSPYVHLTSLVEGMRCTVDINFVLINRESFTQNESFSDKQKEFTIAEPSHGRRTFVTLEDLNKRRFSDSKGEYLLEVNFKNPKTIFEQTFPMTLKTDARTSAAVVDYQRYDTRSFQFGELEW